MILIIADESGESVYDGVRRASYDSTTRRVVFMDTTTVEARSVVVAKGVVSLVDHGVTFKRWVASGEPFEEAPRARN